MLRRIIVVVHRGSGRAWRFVASLRHRRPDVNWRLLARLAPRRAPSLRQFRLLGTVLIPAERRWLRVLIVAAVLSGAALVVRAGLARLHYVPARGGGYTEGIVGAPQLINPLYASGNDADTDLTRLLYAGLLRFDASGELQPDLAEHWELSSDGKRYTVTLRENLRWSDGVPLTVDDVLFTIDAFKNPEWKSPIGAVFRKAAAARSDERTITISLPEAQPSFAHALTVGILPVHGWGDVPPAKAPLAEFNIKPIGAGLYRFKSLTRDRTGTIKTYVMERNPYYHDPAYLDRVTVKFFSDFGSAGQALHARQIDSVGFLPVDIRSAFQGRGDYASFQIALPQLTAVFFNARRQELFKDKAVRAALALAVDRERVVSDSLKGEGEGLAGPLPAGVFPGVPPVPVPMPDAAQALKLLDGAGWKLPAAGSVREKVTRDKKGNVTASSTLAFSLTTVDRSETVTAARVLQEAWGKIGVAVELAIVPASRMSKEIIRPRAYDALLYGEVFGADPDPYSFWHSSQSAEGGLNLSGYANRDADDLLDAARKTADAATRAKKYQEFQKIVMGDVPAIFLYRSFYTYLVDRAVQGVRVERVFTPSDRWNSIRSWYRKTRPTFRKIKN